MKHIVHLVLVTTFMLAVPSSARAAEPPIGPDAISFEAVDSVQVHSDRNIVVAGLPQGETQTKEFRFNFATLDIADRCHKQALLAMERPGRYLLEFTSPFAGERRCRLKRR